MADFSNFGTTANGAASVTVQDWTITCTVLDGLTVLADFTGENALHYPSVLSTLTLEQQGDLLSQIVNQIIMIKAGLA